MYCNNVVDHDFYVVVVHTKKMYSVFTNTIKNTIVDFLYSEFRKYAELFCFVMFPALKATGVFYTVYNNICKSTVN